MSNHEIPENNSCARGNLELLYMYMYMVPAHVQVAQLNKQCQL